jgi:uncharacterized membrane protein
MVSVGISERGAKRALGGLRLGPASVRAIALLACEGAAVALFLRQLRGVVGWAEYVRANASSDYGRRAVLLTMAFGAAIATSAAVVGGMRRPRAMQALSRALCPALLLALVPMLLTSRPWFGRELACLLTVSAVVVASVPLFRASERGLLELGVAGWVADRPIFALLQSPRGRSWARAAVFTAGALLAGYIAFFTVRVHHKLQTSTLDLGLFDNLFYNALHGVPFHAPSASPAATSFLAVHAPFILYLYLPFYALYPHAEALLVLQAVLVAASAVPLYFLAEARLGHLTALAIAASYLLYPPLHGPAFYDFHDLTTSPFFVLSAACFLVRRKWVAFWAFALLTLACREDVALGAVGVGAGLTLMSPWRRTGLALTAIAATYTAIVKFVVMPMYGPPSFLWVYKDLIPPGGPSDFVGILSTVVGNPLYTLGTLFVLDKLVYLLHLFAPVAFLPLRVPRAWWLFFPGAFVALLSTGDAPVVSIRCQYAAHFVPYVFLATVAYFVSRRAGRGVDRPALAAMLFGTLLATAQFGALQRDNFFGGFQRIDFTWSSEEGARLARLRSLAATIPQEASVAASEPEGAHLSGRRDLFALKEGVRGADCIFFSFRSLFFGDSRANLTRALQSGEYGLVGREGEFVLLRRGAPAEQNAALAEEAMRAR